MPWITVTTRTSCSRMYRAHGVRAGIVMAMLKASFRPRIRFGRFAGIARERVQRGSDRTDYEQYLRNRVVCSLAEFGQCSLVGCGHPSAIVLSEGSERTIGSQTMPIGIAPYEELQADDVDLGRTDRLVLFSDGLSEAGVEGGQMLGEDGVLELCRKLVARAWPSRSRM